MAHAGRPLIVGDVTVRRSRLVGRYACAAGVLALTAACGAAGGGQVQTEAAQISPPIPMPAGTFTDNLGRPYDIQSRDRGLTTLVYFGYTNCPDVCPTTMADIGTALRSLSVARARGVQVVFITSDPVRDTPAVMSAWLAHFDAGLPRPYVGLTSSLPKIDAYAAKLGIPLQPPVMGKGGMVEVTHGAETLAFAASDEAAGYVWSPGTTSQQYASDLTTIMAARA